MIWVRGALGIVFANNTATNYSGTRIYALDDDGAARANSLTCVNNVISMAASGSTYTNGGAILFRQNLLNANGFTPPAFPAGATTDSLTTVAIDIRGVPASVLSFGETTSSTVGLDPLYNIPSALITKPQPAIFNKGAVVF